MKILTINLGTALSLYCIAHETIAARRIRMGSSNFVRECLMRSKRPSILCQIGVRHHHSSCVARRYRVSSTDSLLELILSSSPIQYAEPDGNAIYWHWCHLRREW